jgi:putative ABC transport system permease protein
LDYIARGGRVFYLRYLSAELRRRKGRTILTALGLAVGVGMVAIVVALSKGLDDAQAKVLAPLTGVGTDMSVNRPVLVSGSGSEQSFDPTTGAPGLSAEEQAQLQRENEPAFLEMQDLQIPPGARYSRDFLMTTDRLSFPEGEARTIAAIDGVEAIAPALTLNLFRFSGVFPSAPAPAPRTEVIQWTISGVDTSAPELALVTPSQITRGRYFQAGADADSQAIVNRDYANRRQLTVGDPLRIRGRTFTIVGIAKPPLGGETSDMFVPLDVLQKLAQMQGRVNVLRVRAASVDQLSSVAEQIEKTMPGWQVTTAQDLAGRVAGSLKDAQSLSGKLGTALALVALVAAVLIASLLTLSSVSKRTRELGTLKAIGWRKRLVIRQIAGESLAQGLLGGLVGALIGVGGAALITAVGPTVEASFSQTATKIPVAAPVEIFGQGRVAAGSSSVVLSAPVDVWMLGLAIALAVVGGLIAGTIGATRAARLRPAEALRAVE